MEPFSTESRLWEDPDKSMELFLSFDNRGWSDGHPKFLHFCVIGYDFFYVVRALP